MLLAQLDTGNLCNWIRGKILSGERNRYAESMSVVMRAGLITAMY